MSHNNQLKEQARTYMNDRVIKFDERDIQMWKLTCTVPKIHKFLAIFFALINVVLPGFGTMFATCFAQIDETVSKAQIAIGLI